MAQSDYTAHHLSVLEGLEVPDSLPADFGIGYHKDAFAHVTRPSRQPEGAAKSATVAQDGYSLRWIQHYNPLQLAAVVVTVAAGSVVLSHVNDSGFWLVGRFLELDVKTTFRTWTVLETIIGVVGFIVSALIFVAAGAL